MHVRINPLVLVLLKVAVFSSVVANSDEWSKVNTTTGLIDDLSFLTTASSHPNGLFETLYNGSTVISSTMDATSSNMTGQLSYQSTTAPIKLLTTTQGGAGEDNVNIRGFSWYPIKWSWVLILQVISAIVGIVGNFLVIIVLFQRRRKSRSTDTLIGGLACADFITSVCLIPIPWPSYVPKTWLGEVYCRLIRNQSILWASITASTYLLMSISVERYIAIVYPLHFKHLITRRRVSIFIVIIWFLSVLSGLFGFIVYGVKEHTNQCGEQYTFVHGQIIIAYYWLSLRLAVPCLTMLITQILIARKLNRESRNFKVITSSANGTQPPSFHIVARNRVLKMMLIVIVIYFVCWTPNQIAYLGYNLGWVPKSYLNSTLQRFLTVLGFYNSCANPVIYAARYPEFRRALRDMFTCTSPQNAPLFEKGDIAKNASVSEAAINKA